MANRIFDGDGDGSILGSAQTDIIYGGISATDADGGPVINDTIDGGQSDDTIFAGDGDDLIFGGDAGDAMGSGSGAKDVESFEFDIGKADPVQAGTGQGNIGDSILYKNVATAEDGSQVSVRITVVDQTNPNLKIVLGYSSDYPILINDGSNTTMQGESVDIQVEFLDSSGNPVTIDSNFTFRDIDDTGSDGQEGVTFDTTDITSYAVSGDPSTNVQVDDRGDEIEFTTNANGGVSNENLWTQVFFEGQSTLNFTLEARAHNAGYGFDTADFDQPPIITAVDASGDDLLYGGAGDDSILGGGGDDTLHGDAGNDRLDGGEGADTLFGGAGDDTFVSSGGGDLINGGTDLDVVDYSGSDTSVTVDLGAGTASTGDTLIGIDGVIGSEFGDSLAGFDHSGGGSDRFTNILYGAGGDDTLVGRGSGDTLYGGDGADTVSGGTGDDTIYGDAGSDILDGGDGNDRIISGAGSDTAFGGAGSDTFVIEDDPDTDTFFGGDGVDSLDASGFASGVSLDLTNTSSGALDVGDASVVFESVEHVSLTDAADTVTADVSVGNVTIDAAAGDDKVQTGAGDDTIFAGAGNDTINGGAGDNVLTGGEGRDTFVIEGQDYSQLGTEAEIKEAILASNLAGIEGWRGIKGEVGRANSSETGGGGQPEHSTTGGNAEIFDVKKIGDAVEKAMKPLVGNKDAKDAEKSVEDALNDLLESDPGRTFAAKDLSDLAFDVLKEDFGIIKGGIGALGAFGEANEQVEDATRFDLTDLDVNAFANDIRDVLREEMQDNDANALRNDIRDALNEEIEAGKGENVSLNEISKIVYKVVDKVESKSIAKLASEQAYDSAVEQLGFTAPAGEGVVDTSTISEGILDLANDTEITDFEIGEDSLDLSALDYLGKDGLSTNDVKILDTAGDGSGDAILALPDGSTITLRGISVYDLDPAALESMGFMESNDASEFQNEFLESAGSIGGGGGDDVISGGTGDDTITGGTGDDIVAGGAGNDTVYGGTGNDSLTTGTGDDTLFGGSGDDKLANSSGDDILYGGTGNDTVTASLGDDTLYGGSESDGLIGGADNDVLYGGSGDDSLVGGAEGTPTATKFSFEYFETDGESNATLADVGFDSTGNTTRTPDGHGNVDAIDVNALDTAQGGNGETFAVKFSTVLTVTTGGNYTFETTSDDGSKLFVNGTEIVNNDGLHPLESQSGSLALGAGEHVVEIIYFEQSGGEGLSATISGPDTGNTPIDIASASTAASDDDLLLGQAGNDRIDGGLGDDTIYGGDDQDTISVQDNFGADTIYGGEGGTDGDTLDLSALSNGVTVTSDPSQSASFTDGTDSASFFEIEDVILTSSDDDFSAQHLFDGIEVDGASGNDTIVGSDFGATGDTLTGGSGNDLIDGLGGNDTISAGAGNDTIRAGFGSNTFDGGSGNDTYDIANSDVSGFNFDIDLNTGSDQYGNVYNDIENVIGGTQGDSVLGDGANNTFEGRGGDDTLAGGAGSDLIYGGDGADSLTTGTGEDTLYGGAGDDNLANSTGNDTLFGGTGNDTIIASGGNDLLYGGSGNDELLGGIDNDTLYGGAGDDSLDGGNDDDTLYGDTGSDFFERSLGTNTLYGGDDSDTFEIGSGDDHIYGGEGGDDRDTLTGNEADDALTIVFTGNEAGTFTDSDGDSGTFSEIETFILTNDADTVDGSASNSAMTVFADTFNDSLRGSSGDDLLYGEGADDTIDGGAGADTIYGGSDDDRIVLSDGFGSDVIYGGETGDSDSDTLDLSALGSGVTVTFTGDEQGTFTDGTDTGTFFGVERVVLSDQDDVFLENVTSSAPMTIDARGGNDSINTDDGNDVIYGGSGRDSVSSDLGNDVVYGGTGDDRIDSSAGDDVVFGGDGNDDVFLDGGNDVAYGGDGNDDLFADTGNNTMYGGSGSDEFNVDSDDGNFSIFGGAGTDTLDAESDGSEGLNIVFTGDDQGTFSAPTEGASGTFESIEAIEGSSFTDTVDAGNDTNGVEIVAQGGDDFVTGGSGNDVIDGGTGNDSVVAGAGNDSVDGGTGADTLDGGSGEDILSGDSGADSLSGGSDVDILYGGTEGDSLDGGNNTDTLYGGDGDDVVVDTGGGASDDFIYGGAGNDSIAAGQREDTVFGGTGNDTIAGESGDDVIDGGTGSDTISGGSGNDTLTGGTGDDVFQLSASGGDDTVTDFGTGGDQIDTSALSDSALGGAADGTVTADEIVVSGGGGSAQVLTFPNGETLTVPDGTVDTSTTATQFASLVAMGVPPCFAPGTLILTPTGQIPVEDLKIGDLVMTADHGPQSLRWIGRRVETFTTREDRNRPILIGQGALGDGFPTRDLVVSPQHRMVLSGQISEALFGKREVMAIAKGLTDMKGVRVMRGKPEIVYYALLFDCHQIIFAEGAATESFRPGPTVMDGMDESAREAIYAIYPRLAAEPINGLGSAARQLLSGRDSRRLARRLAAAARKRTKTGNCDAGGNIKVLNAVRDITGPAAT